MTAYALRNAGAFASSIVGGSLSPAMPTFNAGDLLLMFTGAFSSTLSSPTISGWTKLSPNSNAKCVSLYARIAVGGDTSPSFDWGSSKPSMASIASFSGDVYTDLTTITSASGDRGTNSTGKVSVPGITPADNNCLFLRGGWCAKTSLNNGLSFADWATVSGVFTKIGEKIQSNSNIAGLWAYEMQTTATNRTSDTAALPTTEVSNTSVGWAVALKTQAAVIITPTRGLLGVGV